MSAPQRTRIKFCGMTRLDDVALAADLGVDAVGLIFVPRSPRSLDLAQARRLREAVPAFVSSVALVMDAEPAMVGEIAQRLRPSLLQFHGAEEPADCARHGLPFLKAIPMAEPSHAVAYAARYAAAAGFVLDSHAAGGAGGSGRSFDWSAIPELARPILLAGGLTPENVFDAVRLVRPWAVDVSSGIESAPGIKDAAKMRRFVDAVRRADAMNQTSLSE